MRSRVVFGALLALSVAAPSATRAQDVELRARPGRPVPPEYYALIRRDPQLFEFANGWIARARSAAGTNSRVEGRLPLAVIQALFADSPEPSVSPAEVQRILFDGPTAHGTLGAFYREMSRGRLDVTGRAFPWVRTGVGRLEAFGASGVNFTPRFGAYLLEALARTDSLVNFGEFDNNGPDGIANSADDDGFVDAVAFLFAERDAPCGGEGPWPHRSRVAAWNSNQPYQSNDRRPNGQPVRVNDYIIQSVLSCDGRPFSPTVIAHELGHVFALPDLYHAGNGILPAQRRWVLGCWSLMAAGGWGCGDGSTFPTATRPTHMGAWEKATLGWITEVDAGSVVDREFILDPVQAGGRVLRVTLGAGEYLLIEYRTRTGFDAELPAPAVLIYHIDLNRPQFPAWTAPRIYRVGLKEADADSALVKTALEGGNRGVATDAWPRSSSNVLSNLTSPSARRNAGQASTVTIHSIQVVNGEARIRLSTAPAPVVLGAPAAAVALQPYTVDLTAAGGALPYQWSVVGATPRGLGVTPEPDRITVRGTPLEHGRYPLTLQIRDALGTVVTQTVTLTIARAVVALERLLQRFTASAVEPLTADEQSYLDQAGNQNGRYDVGDLRRYLRTAGSAPAFSSSR